MNDFLSGRTALASRPRPASLASEPARVLPALKPAPHSSQTRGSVDASSDCAATAAQIELSEINGSIDQIIVTCGCGERITLQCSY